MKLHNFWWASYIIAFAAAFCNPYLGVIGCVLLIQLFVMGICLIIAAAGRKSRRLAESYDKKPIFKMVMRTNGVLSRFVPHVCCGIFTLAASVIAAGMWLGFSGRIFGDAPRQIFPWNGMEISHAWELSLVLVAVMFIAQIVTFVLFIGKLNTFSAEDNE